MDAAKNNGILFYPVIPGKEDRSWERLLNEALDRFKEGEYAGTYEDELLLEFRKSLPETPPWL
jgi:DNA repair photolyase